MWMGCTDCSVQETFGDLCFISLIVSCTSSLSIEGKKKKKKKKSQLLKRNGPLCYVIFFSSGKQKFMDVYLKISKKLLLIK